MVDYMLGQFKTVIGVNGNSKKKGRKRQGQDEEVSVDKKLNKEDGPDFEKCVGYEF